jgi:uncharacterized membrane protein
MNRSVSALLLALAASLSLAACGGEDDNSSGASCPTGSTLTYDTFGKQFITDFCVKCHTVAKVKPDRKAPEGVNFDTMEDIIKWAEDIDETAAKGPNKTNEKMPPGMRRPTPEQREQLGQWLACETKK